MRKHLIGVVLLLLSTATWAANEPIGFIKNLQGEAWVTSAGQRIKAQIGTPIYQGSLLQTGAQSSMGVTFKDETIMSFGANTELSVDEYLYAPAQNKLKLAARISKGSLNYLSGVIAKLQPDAVSVGTPSGTIGIRGTHFAVKVED